MPITSPDQLERGRRGRHPWNATARRSAAAGFAFPIALEIYEEGISAVTHRGVAERAGVAHSAPSYFFPSIDDRSKYMINRGGENVYSVGVADEMMGEKVGAVLVPVPGGKIVKAQLADEVEWGRPRR